MYIVTTNPTSQNKDNLHKRKFNKVSSLRKAFMSSFNISELEAKKRIPAKTNGKLYIGGEVVIIHYFPRRSDNAEDAKETQKSIEENTETTPPETKKPARSQLSYAESILLSYNENEQLSKLRFRLLIKTVGKNYQKHAELIEKAELRIATAYKLLALDAKILAKRNIQS